ncbi:hypothetical protein RUND412_003394 [Rhizina undulata]
MGPPKSPPLHSQGTSAYDSPTFNLDMSIKVDAPVGSMHVISSPLSHELALTNIHRRQGLHIVDLDNPYDPPRFLQHLTAWSVADVQWSPHASHAHWVVSTSNQKAIVWNLYLPSRNAIEIALHGHTRAITDINFSAHQPNVLATCSIDSFVHCWDLRTPHRPVVSFCDWFAGATQVKYNRQNEHILASSHDKYLYIWDSRMGARPVRKIHAHSTKIYGVDWNRTRPSGIITCALDKSVKFWDYELIPTDTPERIIRTSFPVWRARHTPFGWGVLTMPQRGDTSLYLWDRRAKGDVPVDPVAKFEGHTDHVKEFLWRWRGGQGEDGGDNREFQLVSWGLDRDIRLWGIDKELMAKIGHDAKKKMRFRVTRKGAEYKTFRDEAAVVKEPVGLGVIKSIPFLSVNDSTLSQTPMLRPQPSIISLAKSHSRSGIAMSSSMRSAGIGKQLSTYSPRPGVGNRVDPFYGRRIIAVREGGFMRAGRKRRKEINPIAWMKGVKIGRKVTANNDYPPNPASTPRRSMFGSLTWEGPETLGDEISLVGVKFPKINFEKVNIAARTCTVSLTGPWGFDSKWVFLRAELSFPVEYPADGKSLPVFTLEKTNSISPENIEYTESQLKRIAEAHVGKKRVCLEPCLCFLLGERAEDAAWVGSEDEDESSSSDEEPLLNIGIGGMEEDEGIASLIERNNQASVPLPKACGATWAMDGRLICFFPPKEERVSRGLPLTLREDRNRPGRIWESFGRLHTNPPGARRLASEVDDGSDDSFSTSSESSESSEELRDGRLRPSLGWRLHGSSAIARGFRRGGSTDRSLRSTGTGVRTVTGVRGKNIVSIHDFSHLLPVKKELAREYKVYGDGPTVCRHNADVAEKYGFPELADVWRFAELILCNEVPLEVFAPPTTKNRDGDWGERILVMARRASLDFGRRDSGFAGTEEEDEFEAEFWGRVKWGDHPLGGRWLVDELFRYFERKADVQMLAMLSCVFCETEEKVGLESPELNELPLSMHAPAFTLEYYPTIDDALASHPSHLSASPQYHSAAMTPLGTHGSYGSSNGGNYGSDPITPYSTGTTPPITNYRLLPEEFGTQSLSSSPETHHHHSQPHRRPTSGIAVNFRFPPAFAPGGASPPARKRPSPAESLLAPLGASGVTWGPITTFGSGSKPGPSSTITEATSEPSTPNLRITMLPSNTESTTTPLLSPEHTLYHHLYRLHYADILHAFSLPLHRLEILKFNPPPPAPEDVDISFSRRRNEWDGLEIAGHCCKCGAVLDVTKGARGECKACKRRQVTMNCVVCEVIVKGLYAACLKCGHVSHAECHEGWWKRGREECPSGCGCRCGDEEEEECAEEARGEGGGAAEVGNDYLL